MSDLNILTERVHKIPDHVWKRKRFVVHIDGIDFYAVPSGMGKGSPESIRSVLTVGHSTHFRHPPIRRIASLHPRLQNIIRAYLSLTA